MLSETFRDEPDHSAQTRKAALAQEILRTVRARKLTRAAAAGLLGLGDADAARLLHGQAEHLTEEQLLQLMTRLGRNVTIVVGPGLHQGRGRIELCLQTGEEPPPRAHNRIW